MYSNQTCQSSHEWPCNSGKKLNQSADLAQKRDASNSDENFKELVCWDYVNDFSIVKNGSLFEGDFRKFLQKQAKEQFKQKTVQKTFKRLDYSDFIEDVSGEIFRRKEVDEKILTLPWNLSQKLFQLWLLWRETFQLFARL